MYKPCLFPPVDCNFLRVLCFYHLMSFPSLPFVQCLTHIRLSISSSLFSVQGMLCFHLENDFQTEKNEDHIARKGN